MNDNRILGRELQHLVSTGFQTPGYETVAEYHRKAIERLTEEQQMLNQVRTMSPEKIGRLAIIMQEITYHDIVASACEKQVPKKAIKLPEKETFYDGGYHDHKCKVCDIPLNKGMVYCDKCGNIIDWRNE